MKKILMAAAAVLALGTTAAMAQYDGPPPGADPYGYYSQMDHHGYYDRDGQYHHFAHDRGDYRGDYRDGPPPGPSAYYREGDYERSCHNGNAAAGTIFGAIGGGLIGSAVSHGNGGAVVGGVLLGGLLGNSIARDMDCEDHPYAFRVYADGLNGDIGRRYEWHHGDNHGYFTPQREFMRGGTVCRDFTEETYHHGQTETRNGTACRGTDGEWHFD